MNELTGKCLVMASDPCSHCPYPRRERVLFSGCTPFLWVEEFCLCSYSYSGIKESDTGLAPPALWDLAADKQTLHGEQPLQVEPSNVLNRFVASGCRVDSLSR